MIRFEQSIKYLLEFGFTEEQIKYLLKRYPKVYSYGTSSLNQKIEDLIEIGYTRRRSSSYD